MNTIVRFKMKKLLFIVLLAVGCFAQEIDSTSENLDTEKRVIEAERRALEAEKRALDAERRALDVERKAVETERPAPNAEKQTAVKEVSITPKNADESQISIKPSGSAGLGLGWRHVSLDNFDNSFDGMSLGANFSVFFPLSNDILRLGVGIGIGYLSVSANDNGYYEGYYYTEKLTLSSASFNILPEIRIGEITKYVGICLGISAPLSSEMTQKVSFPALKINDTENHDLDVETSYGLGISTRYNYIGAEIYIPFDGDSWALGTSLFLPLSSLIAGDIARNIEIAPSFTYWFYDGGSEFSLSIGFQYSF